MTETSGKVQMNVRVPPAIRDAADARRAPLGISRDEWVTRALTWALRQPQDPVAVVTAPRKRTVAAPRRTP